MGRTTNFLLGFLMIALLSCKGQIKHSISFTEYLPDFKNGKSDKLIGLKTSRDSLKLDTLENGYDSIQIRLWVTYTRKDTFQIFSIKNFHNKWSSEYCEAVLHYSQDHDSLLYYSKTEKHLYPKSDWQPVIDSLLKLNILTLPDCTKIKAYDFPFDGGNSVTIEISTIKQYRLYMYQLRSYYRNKYKEAENVDDILKLLSNEFGIKYLDKF
jgi:hypothetical protein